MKKSIIRLLKVAGIIYGLILAINIYYQGFIDDDGPLIYVSPYVDQHMSMLDGNQTYKLYLDSELSDHHVLLSEDPVVVKELIHDLRWTWVTTLRNVQRNEPYISLRFTDEKDELIYPLLYYPQSDVIVFPGLQEVVSINSSDKLKAILKDHINETRPD
ncbi:hypothetical protein [Brevibacillus migulae]|uniref:hypothetical protein n=1 Tax=Brevibacillus migulae TaxID=1644114 RepID=UPI00106E5037|nr:hypothetical protein [Brevibacillus migulae]